MNVTIANNTDTTIFLNGNMIPPKDYKIENNTLNLNTELKEPYWCPGCLGTGFNRLPWNDSFVCSNCGYQTFPDPVPPFLKEKDILDLGWKVTPDMVDYAPLWISYIIGDGDGNYYELSNEDNDNIWCIQECDEKGNYDYDGGHMFFTLYNKKDLDDLMRLMGLRYG